MTLIRRIDGAIHFVGAAVGGSIWSSGGSAGGMVRRAGMGSVFFFFAVAGCCLA